MDITVNIVQFSFMRHIYTAFRGVKNSLEYKVASSCHFSSVLRYGNPLMEEFICGESRQKSTKYASHKRYIDIKNSWPWEHMRSFMRNYFFFFRLVFFPYFRLLWPSIWDRDEILMVYEVVCNCCVDMKIWFMMSFFIFKNS